MRTFIVAVSRNPRIEGNCVVWGGQDIFQLKSQNIEAALKLFPPTYAKRDPEIERFLRTRREAFSDRYCPVYVWDITDDDRNLISLSAHFDRIGSGKGPWVTRYI